MNRCAGNWGPFRPWTALALAVIAGCSGALAERADGLVAEGRRMIAEEQDLARSGVVQPAGSAAQAERDRRVEREVREAYPDLRRLSLNDVLSIAARYNRDCETQRDGLKRDALALIQARHAFDPQLSGTVSHLLAYAETRDPYSHALTQTSSATLAAEQLLPSGARLSLTGDTSLTQTTPGSSGDWAASSLRLSASQPLLRGAGREATMEPLTAAQRSRLYALRQYEAFRQQFAIDTVRRYYSLVRQKQVIENIRRRADQADFLYRRSQALFKVGRLPQLEVFRAEQDKLQAENDLSDAEQSFRDDLARLCVFLGVPTGLPVDVRGDEQHEVRSVSIPADLAVRLALENRLDVMTARDQLTDAERAVRLARRGLLPDLSLTASAGTSADASGAYDGQRFRDFDSQLGITLQLPLDRLNEKVALRNAELTLDRQRRSYAEFLEELRIAVRSRLRNLERSAATLKVQERIVAAARQRQAVAQIRFRQGDTSTRDLVETQVAVQDAENTYIRYRVDHVVAEMELQRDMGLLRVDEEGHPRMEKLP